MGDAGSLVVGFVLAALNLTNGESYSKGLFSVLFFPVLVLALPIFDTAFVSVVRTLSGRAVSHGGQDHASHRLVAVGLSETAAVLVLHGISIASGLTAFVFYQVGFSYAWFIGVLLVLALILFGVFLANVKVYPEDQVPGDVSASARGHFSLVTNFTYKRTVLWVIVDTLTILIGWYVAFLVRYGQTPVWSAEVGRFTETVPIVVIGMLVGLYVRGLYRTDWQHLSLHELRAIVSGTRGRTGHRDRHAGAARQRRVAAGGTADHRARREHAAAGRQPDFRADAVRPAEEPPPRLRAGPGLRRRQGR